MLDNIVYCLSREYKIYDKMPLGFWACRFLKHLSGLPQVAAWRCSEELEWIPDTGTPWHIFTSVVHNFEFADCFLVVADLHSKPLRSTFLYNYVMCDVHLDFLVAFHRITKNFGESAHTCEQKIEFLKASSVTRVQNRYLEVRLNQAANLVAKHFQNFIVSCDF